MADKKLCDYQANRAFPRTQKKAKNDIKDQI